MADTYTEHLHLIKQDPEAAPDIDEEHENLETLDDEIWQRGKAFNGTPVGEDGGFHIRNIPYAENLETTKSQSSDDSFVIRTTAGEASITDGDGWLNLLRGERIHTGHSPYSIVPNLVPVAREEGEDLIALDHIDDETFIAYVGNVSMTIVLTYANSAWSADPEDYGIYFDGVPKAGDALTVVYTAEVPGTITQSTPEKFVSTDWNLYDHANQRAKLIKYSSTDTFRIDGTYTALSFSYSESGTSPSSVTPISKGFNPFSASDPIGTVGYLFVTGGNATDTVVWMAWTDWTSGYNIDETTHEQGEFKPYSETEVDLTYFMEQRFPYGLMQVGTIRDEINLNISKATSRIERWTNNATNMANAKASGRPYEYDASYIYIERDSYKYYDVLDENDQPIEGGYYASDHGLEWYTGTTVPVYTQTLYGASLKNKLERDVLTISQQELQPEQKAQARANIGAISSADLPPIVNALDSTSTTSSLSAAQGKALNDGKYAKPTGVSISNNATGQISISSGKMLLVVINGYSNTGRNILLVYAGSTGTVRYTEFGSSSGLAFDAATNNVFKISNSSGNSVTAYAFTLN